MPLTMMIDTAMATLSNMFSWRHMAEKSVGGIRLSTATLILTVLLELISLNTVRKVLQQKDGKRLYAQAVAANLVNHYVFGIPVYIVATILFCRDAEYGQPQDHFSSDNTNNNLNLISLAWSSAKIVAIIAIHDFLYWYVHKTMHSHPHYYAYHKFHHKFHTHVPPMSANAVTPVEYVVAYIVPFAVAALLVQPTDAQLNWAVAWTSVANLVLHTPCLEAWTQAFFVQHTPWLVSTHDHMEHHRRLTTNYSAPIFKFDWILAQVLGTKQS